MFFFCNRCGVLSIDAIDDVAKGEGISFKALAAVVTGTEVEVLLIELVAGKSHTAGTIER